MSTGSSTQPAAYPAAAGRPRRGLPRLRDARIRTKLALILFVPLAAVLALGVIRLYDIGNQAVDAREVESLTRLSADVSELNQVLHSERMAAAQYLANARAPKDAYTAAIARSDSRIRQYQADRRELDDVPASIAERLTRIDDDLRTMDLTRSRVSERDKISITEAVLRYGVVATDLVGYGEALGQFAGDGAVGDDLRAVNAFAKAKAGTAEQEAIAYAASNAGDISAEQQAAFIATQTSQQEALLAFSVVASPADQALVDGTVTGDAVSLADQTAIRLARGENVPVSEIQQTFGAVVDLMRWAEQRLEQQVIAGAADETSSISRRAAVEGSLVLLVLLIAIALAIVLARSLVLSLRRLREGALGVAHRDLPEAVARLRDVRNLGDGGADDIVKQVRDPIQLRNRDEVGEVATAFNTVHREAVRIAAEQAALRTSVSAMFLNLARRSQSLVDRMIGELDMIERGEEDPKRLAQLFELDHLATRMRRNDENLLVLAGADSSAPRREDALMVDALRAAQSEVELYNRIEFGTVDTDISIAAIAVNDVVRLVAELLDNATRFSPPNTIVVADGRRIRDYVVIQVEDRGLGMSDEQMQQLNQRLAEPPSVDVAAFRLMGLAVVGRLADRYGIRVELRANVEGGTIAQVTLPSNIVLLPHRPIDGPPPARDPLPQQTQLSRGFSGNIDALPGRSGMVTLPAAEEPSWRAELPAPAQAHPLLPQMPSQRPPSEPMPTLAPTADRPSLPTRVAQPIASTPAAPPVEQPVPAAPPNSWSDPTRAFPAVQPASPDIQVAVGFVTPDGRKVPPPARPASPNPSGWGAALAAMPAAPPPPEPAQADDRAEAPIFLQMQASWFRAHDDSGDPNDWGMPTAGYAPPPSPTSPAPAMAGAVSAPPASQPAARPAERTAPAARPAERTTPAARPAERTTPAARPVEKAVPAARPARSAPASTSDLPPRDVSGSGSGQNGPRSMPPGTDHGGSSTNSRPAPPAEERWRTAADEGWQRAMAAAEPTDGGQTRSGLPKRVPQAQLVPGGVQSGERNQSRRSPDEVRGLLSAYHRGVQRGRTAGGAEAGAGAPAPKEN
ncbi:nitrate- and nitrite sensing domain-containing protein [Actinoplanes sp. NPDC049265]|uniref:sensor histidine kinase n=1 Tax=Actinoplanes sp. NPDC049265 TaxID=3363902 RepID=UPI00371E9DAC